MAKLEYVNKDRIGRDIKMIIRFLHLIERINLFGFFDYMEQKTKFATRLINWYLDIRSKKWIV